MDPKSGLFKMWSASSRRINKIAIAPIIPLSWSKVLRLNVPKTSHIELIEVKRDFLIYFSTVFFKIHKKLA